MFFMCNDILILLIIEYMEMAKGKNIYYKKINREN